MSGDYMRLYTELMAKEGSMLYEPADLVEKIRQELLQEVETHRVAAWGHDDEIAKAGTTNYDPVVEQMEEFLSAFEEALRGTADNFVRNAGLGDRTEDGNLDVTEGLDSLINGGPGNGSRK
ncbi:hypothetical protein ACFO4E_16285 [Nocardiopsis mangrovi]|uniref:WXG100 family type VII secretion target n=1 Tax=Nocardiopsis mangrovi TaxID=1179818 RepID=A0ABV9DYL0_9ACTN